MKIRLMNDWREKEDSAVVSGRQEKTHLAVLK